MRHTTRAKIVGPVLLGLTILIDRPAFAQIDLSGEWAQRYHEDAMHRGSIEVGDYTGIPINEAGRRKAESWDATVQSIRERQCIPHVVTYAMRGPANLRIWKTADPATGEIISWNIQGSYGRPRTIWMDGRPHPPAHAAHTWAGFSTGRWEGNALIVTTTHIKWGWLNRNGVPASDLVTLTEHFIRHDGLLILASVVNDPVYIDEPFIRTSSWGLSLTGQANAWGACGPAQIGDEVASHGRGHVPHHLPGMNSQLHEFAHRYNVPVEATAGGGAKTYPEYMRILQRGEQSNRQIPTEKEIAAGFSPIVTGALEQIRSIDGGELQVLPVQGNVYMLVGTGANITVQVGDDGPLVVDAGVGPVSDKVLAAIRRLSDKPIRYVLNTHAHSDHIGGNESLAKAGSRILGGNVTTNLGSAAPGAAVIAHEQVLIAMSAPTGRQAPTPQGAWPTDTYFTETKEVYVNGEAVEMLHQPAAHTNGDSIVFFRRSDVVSTGDVYVNTSYPVIDMRRGGSLNGIIDALNHILDLTVPRDWQEGGTMVIPGHGRLADEADVVEYRDMLTIIRDRIQAMTEKGLTLEQVKAARPTLDYDGRYGSTTGPWTTDMFVEAAYRTLGGVK